MGIPSAGIVKTAILLALAALVSTAGAAAAVPVTVEPARAAVGETVTVSGPPARVTLEPLAQNGRRAVLGRIGPGGILKAPVPDVPRGGYRVVVAGSSEAPVLEVVALGQETSVALLAFGLLFILAMLVAGIVVHRRWRDAIS